MVEGQTMGRAEQATVASRISELRLFAVLAMVFVSLLLISNTIAIKIVIIGGFVLSAGILCFPASYIFNDVLTEVYGFRRSRLVIWCGFACMAMMALLYWWATKLSPAPFWKGQESFTEFFGFVPRITFASFLAYLFGEFVNSAVLSRMKVWSKGKHLWMRTIGSTVAGEAIDSVIFNVVAFAGVYAMRDVANIVLSGYILKVLYEVIATPLTYTVIGFLKRYERIDVYDYGVRYNPFRFDEKSD